MAKQKYPKNRKIRTDTLVYDLLSRHSLEEIKDTWIKFGMYRAGQELQICGYVVRYLALKNNWLRPLPEHLIKAYKNGNWKNLTTNYIPETNSNQN